MTQVGVYRACVNIGRCSEQHFGEGFFPGGYASMLQREWDKSIQAYWRDMEYLQVLSDIRCSGINKLKVNQGYAHGSSYRLTAWPPLVKGRGFVSSSPIVSAEKRWYHFFHLKIFKSELSFQSTSTHLSVVTPARPTCDTFVLKIEKLRKPRFLNL